MRNVRGLLCLAGLLLALGLAMDKRGLARADGPVTTPPGLAAGAVTAPAHPLGAADREAWEWEVVRLVNQERTSRGLAPLKRNDALDSAAYGHSQDMGVNDFFSHTGSDGSTAQERIEAAGYTSWNWIGENVAAGYSSPAAVMSAWMDSAGHQANILRTSFREIGMGYYYDASDTYPGGTWGYAHYWTQDFGSRYSVYPVIINSEAYSTTSRSVQLYIYGPSGAQEMRFSHDGASWSGWETYSTSKSWTLAQGNSGSRTVYAQVRKDTQTYQASDDIYYVTSAPILAVNPKTITLLTEQGSGVCHPAAAVVQVSNAGGGTLDWDASESSAWFNITQGASTITIACVGSAVGGYGLGQRSGTLTVTATGALDSPQNVSVRLVVVPQVMHTYLPLVAR